MNILAVTQQIPDRTRNTRRTIIGLVVADVGNEIVIEKEIGSCVLS